MSTYFYLTSSPDFPVDVPIQHVQNWNQRHACSPRSLPHLRWRQLHSPSCSGPKLGGTPKCFQNPPILLLHSTPPGLSSRHLSPGLLSSLMTGVTASKVLRPVPNTEARTALFKFECDHIRLLLEALPCFHISPRAEPKPSQPLQGTSRPRAPSAPRPLLLLLPFPLLRVHKEIPLLLPCASTPATLPLRGLLSQSLCVEGISQISARPAPSPPPRFDQIVPSCEAIPDYPTQDSGPLIPCPPFFPIALTTSRHIFINHLLFVLVYCLFLQDCKVHLLTEVSRTEGSHQASRTVLVS